MSKNYEYLIIGRSNCSWCNLAKEALIANDKTFKYVNISELSDLKLEGYRDLIKDQLDMNTVPVVMQIIGGWNQLEEHLKCLQLR